MLNGLKPYPTYKDSGSERIGEIPSHWSIGPIKRHFDVQLGKMLQTRAQGSKDVLVPYLKAQHVQWAGVRGLDLPTMWASDSDIRRFSVQIGDLLVCEGGEVGRCAIVRSLDTTCIIQNSLHRVRPKAGADIRFLRHFLFSSAAAGWLNAITNRATIAHFTFDQIRRFDMPVPPKADRHAVVRFLNHADSLFACFIAAKRKQINLLEEQKQVIVDRAVIHGLDPHTPMKPSGNEGVGDIPRHWSAARGKFLFSEVDERSAEGSEELLSVSHLTGVTRRSEKNINMFMAESYAGHKQCREGDIVVNTMWAWMAAVGVSKQPGIVSPSYGVYRPRENGFEPQYLDLLLRTSEYRSEYVRRSRGITTSRLRLYPDDFLNIRFVHPPRAEQTNIVLWLEEKTGSLAGELERLREEISLMHEFRQRLISDVVTGKLDVREAAAALPDIEPEQLEQEITAEDDEDMPVESAAEELGQEAA